MNTLEPTNTLSPARLLYLCRRFFQFNKRTWTIGFGAAAGVLLLIWLFPILFDGAVTIHTFELLTAPGLVLYLLGGFVLTSRLFYELHSPGTAWQLLTLPATTLEKLLAAWLAGSVIYTAAAMIGLTLLGLVTDTIAAMTAETSFTLFHPFKSDPMYVMGFYLVWQTVFLLGAVYFNRNNFLKTLLSLAAIGLGLFLLSSSVIYLLMQMGLIEPVANALQGPYMTICDNQTLQSILWILFALAVLTISYYRLKKREIA